MALAMSGSRRAAAHVLNAAHRCGSMRLVTVVVPVGSMVAVLSTVAACLHLWRGSSSHVPGLVFPAISELGVVGPQRYVYMAGFALCGLLLSTAIGFFEELVLPELLAAPSARAAAKPETVSNMAKRDALESQLPELATQLVNWGYLSAAGVILQGVFTLEHSVSPQSCVHWGGAVLFILGAKSHADASNNLYDAASATGRPFATSPLVSKAVGWRKFIVNYASAGVFVIPLVVQALGPLQGSAEVPASSDGSSGQPMDLRMMNGMGLVQWGIILQFALFYCTYTLDLFVAARDRCAVLEKERRGKDE